LRKNILTQAVIVFILILGLCLPARAQNEELPVVIRIDISNPAVLLAVSQLPQGMDVASVRPGEYMDIVIKPSQLGLLTGAGISYTIRKNDPAEIPTKAAYHSFNGIRTELLQIRADHPGITRLDTIGTAAQGGKIWCLKISSNPTVDDNSKPGILFAGNHHAREWMTPEICLYIANQLADRYNQTGQDSVTTLINSKEFYIVPTANPDGFIYDHGGADAVPANPSLYWRKNRRQNSATVYGSDLNRGYDGSVDGDIRGAWGSTINSYTSPDSSNDVFWGVSPSGEPEQQAMMNLVKTHNIVAAISFHTYSQLLLWPIGYTDSTVKRAPDDTVFANYGRKVASRIKKTRTNSTYDPMQSSALYPTTGASDDWMYGYGMYQLGRMIAPFTIEADTAFYTTAAFIDSVCPQVWRGALYFSWLQDTMSLRMSPPPVLPPPVTRAAFPSASTDYRLTWRRLNPAANATAYELQELSGPVRDSSTAATNTDAKITLSNFTRSTARGYQGGNSYFSGTGAYRIASITTNNPYPVAGSTDSFRFYSYQGMTTFDRVWVESSVDGRQWKVLGKLFGNTGTTWNRRVYSIGADSGRSLFFRIRYVGDGATSGDGGIYIDNIVPAESLTTTATVSNAIADTSYLITGKTVGSTYYYRVRGYNAKRGWGDWDQLFKVNVVMGPLAVAFTGMNLTATSDGVNIAWRTESEQNCLRWEIERSDNVQRDYVQVGRVEGQGATSEPREYSYTDESVTGKGEYYYRLAEIDVNGNKAYYGPLSITFGGDIPTVYLLSQSAPNPFDQNTTIKYQISKSGPVSLKIYNIAGQVVKVLDDGYRMAGNYSASWDGKDDQGRKAGNGIYLYRLVAGDFRSTKKITLLR
jgi:murein tripeptide amidase MpaA